MIPLLVATTMDDLTERYKNS